MIESPCIKLCSIGQDNICIGCGRTREEIASWTHLSDEDKQRVKDLAQQRLDAPASDVGRKALETENG